MELYTWEYEGKQYAGRRSPVVEMNLRYLDDNSEYAWHNRNFVTNLRPAKVVDRDAVVIDFEIKAGIVQQSKMLLHDLAPGSHQHDTAKRIIAALCPTPPVTEPKKKDLTTEQAWKVINSLGYTDKEKWFNTWGGCEGGIVEALKEAGFSPYAEDWQDILNPKVTEPKGFGEKVMAICSCPDSETPEPFVLVNVQLPNKAGVKRWFGRDGFAHSWDELRNPIILSEGLN